MLWPAPDVSKRSSMTFDLSRNRELATISLALVHFKRLM
jgi:hypothetical protein